MTTPTRIRPGAPSLGSGQGGQASGIPQPEEEALPGEAAPDRRAARTHKH